MAPNRHAGAGFHLVLDHWASCDSTHSRLIVLPTAMLRSDLTCLIGPTATQFWSGVGRYSLR
jgi:hypothetical protein